MIEVPQAFVDQPRFWHGGQEWLASLPERVEEQCCRWRLTIDGPAMHGSNALVVPVLRGSEALALRLAPPEDDVAGEAAALRFWDGRGTVHMVEAEPECGALLLERLDGRLSLQQVALPEAAALLGVMMRRLAVPAPADAVTTGSIAALRRDDLEPQWARLGQPFGAAVLRLAVQCAAGLADGHSSLAVNGDLHYEQVLAGTREEWLCVDPRLLRGDIEYDLGRALWYRLDEMADSRAVLDCFTSIVESARLDSERARTWVVFRAVDYWLWGLEHGLTEDPVRCARLVRIFG